MDEQNLDHYMVQRSMLGKGVLAGDEGRTSPLLISNCYRLESAFPWRR
jgi:hypothetical protein